MKSRLHSYHNFDLSKLCWINFRIVIVVLMLTTITPNIVKAYPPAVGIVTKAQNCLQCHVSNGNWQDDDNLIMDIIDKETMQSLKQMDGSYQIEAVRGETVTVLTVIGYKGSDPSLFPERNAWLYIDPETIEGSGLSKFAPGWNVNLPMACRIIGDRFKPYPDAHLTKLPMTIRPTDAASDGLMTLQFMLTKGDPQKGNPKVGLVSSYFERTVRLKVLD